MIHALENAFAVQDGQGKFMQYRGVFLDITGLKNFQAQLQRERDFTSKILNNTQTMIMVADTAGLISYANRALTRAAASSRPSWSATVWTASFRSRTNKRLLRPLMPPCTACNRTIWS